MAKKSKTQRAKASARRAEKRVLLESEQLADAVADGAGEDAVDAEVSKKATATTEQKTPVKVADKPVKDVKPAKEPGRIATFFQGVRGEMRRVTWPTRTDVLRWSGVVVGALLFFGVYVFVLDNWVVTPILLAISGLGA